MRVFVAPRRAAGEIKSYLRSDKGQARLSGQRFGSLRRRTDESEWRRPSCGTREPQLGQKSSRLAFWHRAELDRIALTRPHGTTQRPSAILWRSLAACRTSLNAFAARNEPDAVASALQEVA